MTVFRDSADIVRPSIALFGDSVVLVGNRFSSPHSWNMIGMRAAFPGKENLPLPSGVLHFAAPLAAFAQDGRLHLLWAEPSEGMELRDTSRHQPRLTRIYHAEYWGSASQVFIEGRPLLWSTARLIYEASAIQWEGGRGSRAVIDRDGTLHLVFYLWGNRQGSVYLRDNPRGVREVIEFIRFPGMYPELGFGPAGEAYLAFINPNETSFERDANSVFVRRSTDGGRTWEAPVLVSLSGQQQAHNVRMAVTPAGQVHLLWLKNRSGGFTPEVIWHSLSDDGGRTWNDPVELVVPGARPPFGALSVAADSTGGVHAVALFEHTESRHGRVYYAHWNRQGWSEFCPLEPDYEGFDPVLATDHRGRLHVAWTRVSRPTGKSARMTAMHMTFTP